MARLLCLLLLSVVYSVQEVYSQRYLSGYCPSPPPFSHFNKTRFFGHWIEVEKTPSMFDRMMRCVELDYSDTAEGHVDVIVRGVTFAGVPMTINGAGLPSTSNITNQVQGVPTPGHYNIRYGFGLPYQGTLTTIIDTDYKEFAIIYSCVNSLVSGLFHSEYVCILSRDGALTNPTRQNVYEKLDALKISRSGLVPLNRAGCPLINAL